MMAARNNAILELTRFWLESRHSCLTSESIPVKVPFGHSDIDLVAARLDSQPWSLPDGTKIIRAIIETKDEHDFDPTGRDFGKRLTADVAVMGDNLFVSKGQKAQFSMLREEHFEKAATIFGTKDFSRVFVVHALDPQIRTQICPDLAMHKNIHWLTIRDIVMDLQQWYKLHANPASLRHTFMGDLWHLLIVYCGLEPKLPVP